MAFKISPAISLVTKDLTDKESGLALRLIDGKRSSELVTEHVVAGSVGIYIFALKGPGGAGGAQPWYIGKTEFGTLGKESLTSDKLQKYATAFYQSKGKPVLYFLVPNDAYDTKRIDKLEQFLIWLARQKNPALINTKKVRLSPESLNRHLASLRVAGLINGGSGAPGKAATAFRSMIGWRRTMHVSSSD